MPFLDRTIIKKLLLQQANLKNNWSRKLSGVTIAMTEQVESFKYKGPKGDVNVDLYKIIFHHAVATGKQHKAKIAAERIQELAITGLTAGIGNNVGNIGVVPSIGDIGIAASDIGAGGTVEIGAAGGFRRNHHEAVYRSLKKTDRWEAAMALPQKYKCLIVKVLSQDIFFNLEFVMYLMDVAPVEIEKYYPFFRAGTSSARPYLYRLHNNSWSSPALGGFGGLPPWAS